MTKKIKCECPFESNVPIEAQMLYSEEEKSGMIHEPNKCNGTNKIRRYRRGEEELYLCSCCNLPGDEPIK